MTSPTHAASTASPARTAARPAITNPDSAGHAPTRVSIRHSRRSLLGKLAPATALAVAVPALASLASSSTALALPGAGAVTLITPFRLQDSRTMEPDKYDTSARDSLADPVLAGHLGALLNVTVTETEGAGFFRLGETFQDPPQTSNINWWGPGQTLANLAVVQLSALGGFSIQGGGTGRAHLIIDVLGYTG